MNMKILLGLFGLTFVVWLGLFSFFDSMDDGSKVIFYLVTSWLLLLVVLIVKEFFREKQKK